MKNQRFFLLFFIILCCQFVWAQPRYVTTFYNEQDGLSQGRVTSGVQAANGLIWFSTWNGLNVFDGYRFHYYKDDLNDGLALSRNRIDLIRISATGNVWGLCYDRVCLFDILEKKFTNVSEILEAHCGYPISIDRILSLSDGFTWLEDENGNAYRINDRDLSQVQVFEHVLNNKRDDFVLLDSHGNEWLLGKDGLMQILPDGSKGLSFNLPNVSLHVCEKSNRLWVTASDGTAFYYDYATKQHRYIDMPVKLGKQRSIKPFNDSLLLCSFRKVFVTINMRNDSITCFRLPEFKEEENNVSNFFIVSDTSCLVLTRSGDYYLWKVGDEHAYKTATPKHLVMSEKDINKPLIFYDNYGDLLLLTYHFDLFSLDEKANAFHSMKIPCSSNSVVRNAFQDSQSNLWIYGAKKDLCKVTFLDNLFDIDTFASDDEVRASMYDSYGRLWLASRDGKIRLFSLDGQLLGYMHPDGHLSQQPVVFNKETAYALYEDSAHYVWMGLKFQGLYRLQPASADGSSYKVSLYQHDAQDIYSLSDNDIYAITQDSYGRLWVGIYDEGLNLIVNPYSDSPTFINAHNKLKRSSGVVPPGVRCLKQVDKVMLVGSTAGLFSFSLDFIRPEDIVFHLNCRGNGSPRPMGDNDVMFINEARNGQIYVATFSGGMNRIESENLLCDSICFRSYTSKDGASSDIAFGIVEDDYHSLWIVSESVIQRYNMKKGSFENYGIDYFNSACRFSENPPLRLPDGRLLISTQTGAIIIDPSLAEKNQYNPPLLLTDVIVNNHSMSMVGDTLTLKPNERNVLFHFAALDYFNKAAIQYAYRLEGVDHDWHYTSDMRSASYVNLDPGVYRFHVHSTNRFGVWESNDKVCTVICLPTFWETSWAVALYVLIFLIVAVCIAYTYQHIYKLRHNLKLEKELTDIKLRFFTDISHELRTPITLIDGPVSEVIEHTNLPEPYHHYLLTVQSNARRMLNLVNQVLDFRKLQSGKMKLLVEHIEVVECLRRIMDNFTAMAEKHHIQFELHSSVSETYLWIDRDKFEKIFFNLIGNAFKYTEDGKSITIEAFDADGHFHIVVKDEGCGIEPDRINELFLRFDTILQNNLFKPSSGIGLSLVKQFADLHHARIDVKSEVGKGSEFEVIFCYGKEQYTQEEPVEYLVGDAADALADNVYGDNMPNQDKSALAIGASTDAVKSKASQDAEDNDYDSDQLSILVVEDNPDLRSFLTSILSKDYRVLLAADGQKGFALAKKEIPDLIITDISMPVMDGLEMTRKLKESDDTSHIPVIALTARVSLDDQLEGVNAGVRLYISKPFSATLLKAQIVMILQNRQEVQSYYMKQLCSDRPDVDDRNLLQPSDAAIYSQDKKFIEKMVKVIEQNIANGNYGIDELSSDMAASRSTFYRKVKALTGQSPMAVLQEIRLKRAMQLLKYGHYSISEVSLMVGFADPKYFSRCFKKTMGLLPSEVPHEVKPEDNEKY